MKGQRKSLSQSSALQIFGTINVSIRFKRLTQNCEAQLQQSIKSQSEGSKYFQSNVNSNPSPIRVLNEQMFLINKSSSYYYQDADNEDWKQQKLVGQNNGRFSNEGDTKKIYTFDKLFDHQNQKNIYEEIGRPIILKTFEGYNGTIFAYGQTGSGKTYTMYGKDPTSIMAGQKQKDSEIGLIPRAIEEVYQKIYMKNEAQVNSLSVKCSFVELYKQQLIDLFSTSSKSCSQLKIKQSQDKGVYVQNLTYFYAQTAPVLLQKIQRAVKTRKVSPTELNQQSSRSHTILTIFLVKESHKQTVQYQLKYPSTQIQHQSILAKLCLVDLAGSQKVKKSCVNGQTLEQTKKINFSLSCLGNVINALTARSSLSSQYIPFRDCKLTRLLKDSLNGKFNTGVIITCSTDQKDINQTISSLKFGQRVKKVKMSPQVYQSVLELEKVQHQKKAKFHQRKLIRQKQAKTEDNIKIYQEKIRQLTKELEMTQNQLKKCFQSQSQKQLAEQVQNDFQQRQIQQQQQICHKHRDLFAQQEVDNDCDLSLLLTQRLPIPTSQRANINGNAYLQRNQNGIKMQKPSIPSLLTSQHNLPQSSALVSPQSQTLCYTDRQSHVISNSCLDQSQQSNVSLPIQELQTIRFMLQEQQQECQSNSNLQLGDTYDQKNTQRKYGNVPNTTPLKQAELEKLEKSEDQAKQEYLKSKLPMLNKKRKGSISLSLKSSLTSSMVSYPANSCQSNCYQVGQDYKLNVEQNQNRNPNSDYCIFGQQMTPNFQTCHQTPSSCSISSSRITSSNASSFTQLSNPSLQQSVLSSVSFSKRSNNTASNHKVKKQILRF